MWLPLTGVPLGTWSATKNRTGDPLVLRPALTPLSHTSQGKMFSCLCSELDTKGRRSIPQTSPEHAVWLFLATLTPWWWSSELSGLPDSACLAHITGDGAWRELEGLISLGKGCSSLCLKSPWRDSTMWMSGRQKMAEHTTWGPDYILPPGPGLSKPSRIPIP